MNPSNTNSDGGANEILSNIAASTEAFFTGNEPDARMQLLSLSHQLIASLETPSEAIQRIGWAEPARFAAMRLAIELEIFDLVDGAIADLGAPLDVSEIATLTGADIPLIARTMRHLSAMNIVKETNVDEFILTDFSRSLTAPEYRDGIKYCFDVVGPCFHGIPAYLKKSNYKNPNNGADGPLQYAHNTKNSWAVWLHEWPERVQHYRNYMRGYRRGKRSWMDPGCYPVYQRLEEGWKREDSVFLVDVGGGFGDNLKEFRAKFGHITGLLVLQDREDVFARMGNVPIGIVSSVHDFFTPQPITAARAYLFRSVLHNWDDASCLKILQNIVPAMQPGYSKLLINDYVVPNSRATWSITSADWLMMATGPVYERTEKEWRSLLERAGLTVAGIWKYDKDGPGLIEAELDVG